MLTVLLAAIAAFASGAALAWLVERSRGGPRIEALEKSNRTLLTQWTEARELLDQARAQLGVKEVEIARLEERNQAERRIFDDLNSKLPDTFKTLASEVLEAKSKTFAEENQRNLRQILNPLQTELTDFRKKIEDVHQDQLTGGATLKQQVEILVASTTKVGEEANSLAAALKGSNKIQGNWGELVLERILENAALRRGEEYEVQESYSAGNGRRSQPDVVIHLPGERHLIIDSKVSLVDYEEYSNAPSDEARAAALTDHANSVRAHIKGLAEKNYQALYGLTSLDFVIMFLPIEPALMLALSRDDKLWEWAWQRNVLLVSPSTLLFVLRTVACLWRQEQQQRNARDIASRGAALYDKLAGFVDDLMGVGKGLDQAQSKYSDALRKLHTGSGNVLRQAEMLRDLGIKPAKQLPQGLVELAQQEDLELGDPSSLKGSS